MNCGMNEIYMLRKNYFNNRENEGLRKTNKRGEKNIKKNCSMTYHAYKNGHLVGDAMRQ